MAGWIGVSLPAAHRALHKRCQLAGRRDWRDLAGSNDGRRNPPRLFFFAMNPEDARNFGLISMIDKIGRGHALGLIESHVQRGVEPE